MLPGRGSPSELVLHLGSSLLSFPFWLRGRYCTQILRGSQQRFFYPLIMLLGPSAGFSNQLPAVCGIVGALAGLCALVRLGTWGILWSLWFVHGRHYCTPHTQRQQETFMCSSTAHGSATKKTQQKKRPPACAKRKQGARLFSDQAPFTWGSRFPQPLYPYAPRR